MGEEQLMKIIQNVEIKYFRSIYNLRLRDCGGVNVISGKNDVGKSNILRALNLFFNGKTDWESPMIFSRDFSVQRLEQVRKETVKGKQFVQVVVEFERPTNYKGSLPEKFIVKRTWSRDQSQYSQSDNLNALHKKGKCPGTLTTAQRMLSNFLNRIHFEYIPAVKDRAFYNHLLSRLQASLLGSALDLDSPISDIADNLATHIGQQVVDLRNDFERATGLRTSFRPPKELSGLFQAFDVAVPSGDESIPLILRGDGMQARYIPSVLHYIAKNSTSFFIWGFEEPENSLEYSVADTLASDLQEVYAKDAQIFLTSHSPAIVSRQGDDLSCYRIHQSDGKTGCDRIKFPITSSTVGRQLSEEIGLLRIQQEVHEHYKQKLNELHTLNAQVRELEREIEQHELPMVLVEGPTDKAILETAWEKLHSDRNLPFVIRAADPTANTAQSSGGAGMLAKKIETIHPDENRIVLALFDHDSEGFRCFEKLSKNFHVVRSSPFLKKHKNGISYALTLGDIDSENEYAATNNLSIEFLFPEKALETKNDKGLGLEIIDPPMTLNLGAHKKNLRDSNHELLNDLFGDLKFYRSVGGGKSTFASEIVPTLGKENFEAFDGVFQKLLDVASIS